MSARGAAANGLADFAGGRGLHLGGLAEGMLFGQGGPLVLGFFAAVREERGVQIEHFIDGAHIRGVHGDANAFHLGGDSAGGDAGAALSERAYHLG